MKAWIARLGQVPDALAALMLLFLVLVTVVDVVGRYLFRAPIGGADELTVFCMAIGIFAVFPRLTWREEHVSVDLIDMVYPKRWIAARQMLMNLLAAAFMGVATWRLWILATRLTEDGEITMFLRLPKGPLAYFIVAMCALATSALCANVLRYALGRGPLAQTQAEPGTRVG
jgi:TRAP-type C4-dicarboxylate transport system permease small subunit